MVSFYSSSVLSEFKLILCLEVVHLIDRWLALLLQQLHKVSHCLLHLDLLQDVKLLVIVRQSP